MRLPFVICLSVVLVAFASAERNANGVDYWKPLAAAYAETG